MDRMITATEANHRFSELLRDVAAGDSFTVTSRGRPVAKVTPVDPVRNPGDIKAFIERMAERPVRISGPWTRDDLYG